MVIGIPKEILPGEKRVALVPDTVTKLIKKGFSVRVQKDAGLNAGFTNQKYEEAGAKIVESVTNLFGKSDIILKVQRPLDNRAKKKCEVKLMRKGSLFISFMYSLHYPETAQLCADAGVNVISMDAIPRTTLAQRMDALSSQANIAGYKSVILAGNYLHKIFPMLMTAAGTITPAKVVIMGAGVAGLSALGTAKRLGAVVEVSDVRPQVKEEVLSLGGKFIEVPTDSSMQDAGGYAKEQSQEFLNKQKELIFKHITEADIVITTALVPGKKSPILVTEEMVKNMRPGSVVLDMAVEFGGNCEISKKGKTFSKYGVTIIGEPNLPSLVAYHSSELYSRNLFALLDYISDGKKINYDLNDKIIGDSLIVYNGKLRKK